MNSGVVVKPEILNRIYSLYIYDNGVSEV
jgi:hypothetical protein